MSVIHKGVKIASNSVTGDTLPVGTIVNYEGSIVPPGYELVTPNLVVLTTTTIGDTATNIEQTILTYSIPKAGTYLLLGSVLLNNYGIQVGRELYLKVKLAGVDKFVNIGVINSEIYVLARTLALPIITTADNQVLTITVWNNYTDGTSKHWSCNASCLYLLKLF